MAMTGTLEEPVVAMFLKDFSGDCAAALRCIATLLDIDVTETSVAYDETLSSAAAPPPQQQAKKLSKKATAMAKSKAAIATPAERLLMTDMAIAARQGSYDAAPAPPVPPSAPAPAPAEASNTGTSSSESSYENDPFASFLHSYAASVQHKPAAGSAAGTSGASGAGTAVHIARQLSTGAVSSTAFKPPFAVPPGVATPPTAATHYIMVKTAERAAANPAFEVYLTMHHRQSQPLLTFIAKDDALHAYYILLRQRAREALYAEQEAAARRQVMEASGAIAGADGGSCASVQPDDGLQDILALINGQQL
eukprot:TRINITY_DN2443_c0_g1_i1.p1 TRINITY_DN2443_c0_g1~~TRINITY_DN2443_c0_g1_i1.p1  ORF type:complete len:360 (-),score=101.15 TRINITY_DN2443_c0_g1_i1:29-952(-)